MPKIIEITPDSLEKAKAALKHLPNSKLQFRLLAIVKSAEKTLKQVSDFFDIHYTTLSKWIQRFEQDGIDGLQDKPKGHRPRQLSDSQLDAVCGWIEGEVNVQGAITHWTLDKLRLAIQAQWAVSVAIGPLWRLLKQRGYSHKCVRPQHTNRPSAEDVEAFKKTLPSWSKTF
jgi:transposase